MELYCWPEKKLRVCFCGFAWYCKSTGFLNPKCLSLLALIKEHILVVQRQTLMI